jgi:nuclear transport factor 2 (NTF2) superfamily protein
MIATNKTFELINGTFTESQKLQYSGHTFTSNGIQYRNIFIAFLPDFQKKEWKFIYELYMLDPINNKWSYVKNHEIIGDDLTYRDANGNFFKDSGNNNDANNAYTYDEQGNKTLKAGLQYSEWEQFWLIVLDAIVRPELEASLIYNNVYGITEIV